MNPALERDACYGAVRSRDRRFDGVFFTGVRTTGIYCRPSCPARTPAPGNVEFHRTAAAAQAAGFRACKRCRPDATPGSPDWDVAADVAGRAMRLIADGVVDREGVEGLAGRIGYTARHLSRILTAELGAGPLALARAQRAQTARVLIETTDLGFADAAFASGFSSVRQFNDTVREVYAATPTALRGRRASVSGAGTVSLRLAVRAPFAGRSLFAFLARRAVPGVEEAREDGDGIGRFARTLGLPHGHGIVEVELCDLPGTARTAFVPALFRLTDLRDLTAAVERTRRLLDADCDPVAVDTALVTDPVLAGWVRRRPGLRVPGHVDGHELAIRAVLGQQITVAAARTAARRLTERVGTPLDRPYGTLTHLFPDAEAVAALAPDSFRMPRSRGNALTGLCRALSRGEVSLDRGPDRAEVRRRLQDQPGIGAWTADYIALRALGDPDVLLPTDTGTRDACIRAELDPRDVTQHAEGWRPWRSYAQVHLWTSLSDVADVAGEES